MSEQAPIEFGTDGIRGVAGEYPLDPVSVLHIGHAIGAWLRAKVRSYKPRVVIGHDTRISGHMLLSALSAGILAEGIDVMDATVMPTPGISFLTQLSKFDLGIVISASHNPIEQNGIKLFAADGFKITDEDEQRLEALIAERHTYQAVKQMGYFYRSSASQEHYLNYLANCFDDEPVLKGLKVVIDCANGASTPIAGDVFHRLGVETLLEQNAAPDGLNINFKAGSEFVRRDRLPLLNQMMAINADLGIAFDGDGDRVVCVTPEGSLIDGDHLLGILALELKEQGKLTHDTVVATDMSNSGLEDFLTANGIKLLRTKVGDRYVMEKMREGGYTLGGEQAGHLIMLDDNHRTGDGIYMGLLVAELVAKTKRIGGISLYERAVRIPRYPQVIASAHLDKQVDLATVEGLTPLREQTLVRFNGKGRLNLRFSGTEPNLLRAMVEGGSTNDLTEVIEAAKALCMLVAEATATVAPKIDIVDCATGTAIV